MRSLIAFVLGLIVLGVQAAPYPPVSVEVRAVQIGKYSYYIPGLAGAASAANEGFMSNAGFVITPQGVVVFDSLGTPSLAEAMLREIRRITPAPIRRVILSHYHADHYYGLQVFKDAGAEIWAHALGRGRVHSEEARLRFEQRKEILAPWISDDLQRFLEADVWLEGDTAFELGGVHFQLRHVGPAHTPEDLAMYVVEDRVLFAGDLVFKGRVPFVGNADSRRWLAALDKLLALEPQVLVPGHGGHSSEPMQDLILTRDYLVYLREQMGKAVAEMIPFEEAYRATDWSRFEDLPAFSAANRINAYHTYLLLEAEALGGR